MTELEKPNDGQLLAEFAARADEAAFAELVRRHGAMVYGVCRRILEDCHEAEDVTQAVFLTLARKAACLRQDPSVGGWLHHVATCLARNARSAARSRERREALSMQTTPSVVPPAGNARVLREELDYAMAQLPSRYRLPLVLFHLEERSLEETARALGLKASAASARLVRGREMLRRKLVRCGVTLGTVGALTTLLSAEAGAAVLPASFVSATVKAASLAATGQLAAGVGTGVVSARVAVLVKGAEQMLYMIRLKTIAAAVAVSMMIGGVMIPVGLAVAEANAKGEGGVVVGNRRATPVKPAASRAGFSSRAWRGDDASGELARAGIRVFQIGGWGPRWFCRLGHAGRTAATRHVRDRVRQRLGGEPGAGGPVAPGTVCRQRKPRSGTWHYGTRG